MSDIMDVAPITDVPAIADDQLLIIADQAEKRIEAVKKIKSLVFRERRRLRRPGRGDDTLEYRRGLRHKSGDRRA